MTTTVAARRPLLGSESRIAHCIGNELDLAAKLADCGLKPGYAVAVRRAVDDPRLVLRGQMQDNMRGRRPGRA